MRYLIASLAIFSLACGGGDSADQVQTQAPVREPAAQAPAAESAQPSTGTVHEVQMLQDDGKFIFSPSKLTIRAGDTVRWINVKGAPHNVAFYAARIPAGAAQVLNGAMANRISELAGPMLLQTNETYEISFLEAPAGQYDYYCIPHEALGMKASITVAE